MVHLGFADFVTVVFRQGTLADHEIYVDGVMSPRQCGRWTMPAAW